MARHAKQQGFTFLELLMVFSVISILVMIFMPSIHRMREKGRQATCIGNQRQLAVAALLYANECRSNLPTDLAQLSNGMYLQELLDKTAPSCGSAYAQSVTMSDMYHHKMQLLQCPDSETGTSYGLNVMVAGWRLDLIPNAARHRTCLPIAILKLYLHI